MIHDGRMNLGVALLFLAGLGLSIAGAALTPENLGSWLQLAATVAISHAFVWYTRAARRRLDPRRSEETVHRITRIR